MVLSLPLDDGVVRRQPAWRPQGVHSEVREEWMVTGIPPEHLTMPLSEVGGESEMQSRYQELCREPGWRGVKLLHRQVRVEATDWEVVLSHPVADDFPP